MTRYRQFLVAVALISSLTACGGPEPAKTSEKAAAGADVTYFFNLKLVPGDGSQAADDTVFVSENGKIKAMGKKGEVKPPQGAARADLNGETIMPVFVNLNAHPGLVNGPTFGPANYNHDSVVNDLKRYLYYGVGAVLVPGTDKDDISLKVRDQVKSGEIKAAQLYTAGQRIVPKGSAGELKGMVTEVATAADARGAVDELADKKVNFIAIGIDEGTGASTMKPEIYKGIIDEAHKKNLKVVADAFALADAKELVNAGVDGLIQSVRDREVYADFVNAMKSKNVFLTPALTAIQAKFVYGDNPKWLGEQSMREAYPAELSAFLANDVFIGKMKRDPNTAKYREQFTIAQKNLKKLSDGGVKIGLGTASGSPNTFPGYFEHRELELMVEAGMPIADVYKDATSVSADLLGMTDGGTLAVGKRADFNVFSSNPFDKIANSKEIDTMYIGGQNIERLPLIQGIPINVPKVTEKEKQQEKEAEHQDAIKQAEAKLPHYGKFPLDGKSENVAGLAVPMPLHSTHSKSGNTIHVSMQGASAGDFKGFFGPALEKYSWTTAGNCWEKPSTITKKMQVLCLQASEGNATLTVTQK